METVLLISCIKIFVCRILDMSLATIRTVLNVKEKSFAAALVGFLEAFIYYIVVRDALTATGNVLPIAMAYGAGFAMGTFVGGKISSKVISGNVIVRSITSIRDDVMLNEIRAAGYAITVFKVEASEFGEKKYMILANIDKKKTKDYEALIKKLDPGAFIIVEDARSYVGGYSSKK